MSTIYGKVIAGSQNFDTLDMSLRDLIYLKIEGLDLRDFFSGEENRGSEDVTTSGYHSEIRITLFRMP